MRIVDQPLWENVKFARQGTLKAVFAAPLGAAPGYWDRRRPRYLFTGLMLGAPAAAAGSVNFNKGLYRLRERNRNKRHLRQQGDETTMRRDDLETAVLEGPPATA